MKTTIWKSTLLGLLIGGMVSCDVLDIEPLDSYTEPTIFSSPTLTEAYVLQNYTLPQNGWGSAALRFSSDESYQIHNWNSVWTVNTGGLTPDQLGNLDIWSLYYENIKNCNIFFNNTDKMEEMDKSFRNLLIAEATFFRAYYYMELTNRFGGVPLITRVFDLEDPDMMIKRNSYDECVEFVTTELQKAADLLPNKHTGTNFGRVTKGAALAMKSRMLLYAASPLWNTSGDKAKWQAAADAAEAVMAQGYELDSDYKGLFRNIHSSEIIFQRLYTSEYGHWFDGQNSPNGWYGYSATAVLQELVDSYEMEDGTMPNPDIYTTATSNPWAGRDPRFYASIVCDGQQFKNREAQFYINEDLTSGGSDSEFGINSWDYSRTHYTIRKFINEEAPSVWDVSDQPWIYCRLAEIYLNYAEAMYHTGNEDVAREYVNKIRKRARNGNASILPDVTESGDALLKRIQNERRVELAFEEHRYHDVRRWKIAEETDNGPVHGIKIIKKANGDKSYSIIKVQDRKFIAPNHYLAPIPQYERRKNELLEQNPGYSQQ